MDEKLKYAVSLYKNGNKPQAAKLLAEIVKQDPNNSTAWYGLALCLDETDKKVYCLKKVVSLDPSQKKAQQLLEKLLAEKNLSSVSTKQTAENSYQPPTQMSASSNFKKETLDESKPGGNKLLFALIGLVFLLVICVSIAGVTSWTMQVQAKNAQETATAEYLQTKNAQAAATAEYLQCSDKFENEMTRLLSQFFRQESIADVTARINLPEQISRLEDIRTEAWNMPEKSCKQKAHALLMNYLDKSIETFVAFSGNDSNWGYKYIDSLVALSDLDDEVIRTFDKGGLVSLFRAKGYFYWEGLDKPDWKNGLGG